MSDDLESAGASEAVIQYAGKNIPTAQTLGLAGDDSGVYILHTEEDQSGRALSRSPVAGVIRVRSREFRLLDMPWGQTGAWQKEESS